MADHELLKLTGLWKGKTDKGTFLAGKLGVARLLIFKNNRKQKDNEPDYIAYLGRVRTPDEDTSRDLSGEEL
jgi:hypothetical protein